MRSRPINRRQLLKGLLATAALTTGLARTRLEEVLFAPYDHVGWFVTIKDGAGRGQTRIITYYDGIMKIPTVSSEWDTPPDNSSVFTIYNEVLKNEAL